MSDEIGIKSENAEDGDKVAKDETEKNDTETKEPKEAKPRTVSFNRDVHVKRFGKPRESRGTSSEKQQPVVRKEPFTHLSQKELIEEANKVIAQADSVTCTADHPPEKFFSLPHRRKLKEDRTARRNSDDSGTPENKGKSSLGRSTSDVGGKRRKDRTSLSTLFRRAQRNKSPESPVAVSTISTKPVKRSKSDISDLKSNTNIHPKPIRKRSGSETEEFLKSLRNKKGQLSPIIESSPRDDYFKTTPPLDLYLKEKEKLSKKDSTKSESLNNSGEKKVNPVEKPPRTKSEKQEPKPPTRTKRGKSLEKERSPSITATPKRKVDTKKRLLVDEIDSSKSKDPNSSEIKDRIKDSIRKIEENIYGNKEMTHSSQQPPEKPPLTRGHTVDHIVKILKEDQQSPPPMSHLISPSNGTNINQPFSYTKPSVSPDPNLFTRNTSPEMAPVNKMTDKGVVYAKVVKDHGNHDSSGFGRATAHKSFSPPKERSGNFSDEDEGLGYEERYKYSRKPAYEYNFKNNDQENLNSLEGYKITDSPIKPRFREYKLTTFDDFEPTYANEYPSKEDKTNDFVDGFRGRADGMDTKRRPYEEENAKIDLDFNELSHRRKLLESRLNARRIDRVRNIEEPISRYLAETDPIYEAEKRMKATEKYVNETARYYRHTLERDGFAENNVTEDYNKYDSDNHKVKYNTETRTFQKVQKDEMDRREFIDRLGPEHRYRDDSKEFPPEPEYEPPSLEFTVAKPIMSPGEYKEKKYKSKKNVTSSQDVPQFNQKYKVKDDWFGKRKGHYASNPEIGKEREEDYANLRNESYHNSLRRVKNKNKHYKEPSGVRRHDSGDSRDYYREEQSPRRLDIDNRLVDSGIENDFRKDSSGEIHRNRHRHESDEDVRNTSLFLANERRHTEDNYPSEQIYANGEYMARFEDFRLNYKKDYVSRENSADERSHLDIKGNRYEKSPSRHDKKVSAKPPKATKKFSGLEKVKQLFSRDSSKKSKKEKEIVQPKNRTRVLKSPEHLARDDSEYRRYTDPEPSDIEVTKKKEFPKEEERRNTSSREDDRYRSSDPRDSDPEMYREEFNRTLKEDRRYKERKEEKRRYNSSDRESDHHRPSDAESNRRKSRSRTAGPLDSPALAERYRERRRLATPSPTPSPPRRHPTASTPTSAGNWFKSLDRLSKKKSKTISKADKLEKESVITTEDESTRKTWSKPTKSLNSPAKNLRFFGDTDQDSDANVKHSTVIKSKSHPQSKTYGTLRKTTSNSSTGLDEVDNNELSAKSYSLTNLHRDNKSESPRNKQYYKRNLHNISEIHSNSETESQADRKISMKPPISPYDRRSRSHSSSKTLKGSKSDLRRNGRSDERGSSSELRNSKQDVAEMKHRRRTPATNSGESSTEGDSSHQSQRSVVYLHATTVGDIPDPGQISRNRSRDDVSSVNSSNLQIKSTTKSFSIFAPWTPRHYGDQHDVHYAQRPRKQKPKEVFKKSSSTKNLSEDRPATLQKNKSYSQTTLSRRPQSNRLSSSNTTLYRKPEKRVEKPPNAPLSRRSAPSDAKKSQSSEVLNRDSDRERVSRSISMPKDNNKKAGWFKLSNKKKQENTRVR